MNPTDQDTLDRDQAAYHADMLAIERLAIDNLKLSLTRSLTLDEAMAIAWRGGFSTEFRKQIRT